MKRILYVLLLILLFDVDNIFAKEIIIDNVKYDDSSDIEGKGYRFESNTKVLYLDGYNGGSILYDDFLEIRINNVNIINGDGKNGIDAREVDIYGDGNLNIYNSEVGIECERIQMEYAIVYISKSKNGIIATGNELYLYLANLIIEECDIGIYSPDNIALVYSKMNIINCDNGIYNDKVKTLALNESDMYIKTNNYCLYNIKYIDITLSRVVLKSLNLCINQENDYKNEENKSYVSEDDLNYFIDDNNFYYRFIKISDDTRINDLLINDEGLIIEVDRDFLLNNKENNEDKDDNVLEEENEIEDNESQDDLNIVTKGEYTEEEYSKIEIINPQTIDNIHMFIITAFLSILIIIVTLYIRRTNG